MHLNLLFTNWWLFVLEYCIRILTRNYRINYMDQCIVK